MLIARAYRASHAATTAARYVGMGSITRQPVICSCWGRVFSTDTTPSGNFTLPTPPITTTRDNQPKPKPKPQHATNSNSHTRVPPRPSDAEMQAQLVDTLRSMDPSTPGYDEIQDLIRNPENHREMGAMLDENMNNPQFQDMMKQALQDYHRQQQQKKQQSTTTSKQSTPAATTASTQSKFAPTDTTSTHSKPSSTGTSAGTSTPTSTATSTATSTSTSTSTSTTQPPRSPETIDDDDIIRLDDDGTIHPPNVASALEQQQQEEPEIRTVVPRDDQHLQNLLDLVSELCLAVEHSGMVYAMGGTIATVQYAKHARDSLLRRCETIEIHICVTETDIDNIVHALAPTSIRLDAESIASTKSGEGVLYGHHDEYDIDVDITIVTDEFDEMVHTTSRRMEWGGLQLPFLSPESVCTYRMCEMEYSSSPMDLEEVVGIIRGLGICGLDVGLVREQLSRYYGSKSVKVQEWDRLVATYAKLNPVRVRKPPQAVVIEPSSTSSSSSSSSSQREKPPTPTVTDTPTSSTGTSTPTPTKTKTKRATRANSFDTKQVDGEIDKATPKKPRTRKPKASPESTTTSTDTPTTTTSTSTTSKPTTGKTRAPSTKKTSSSS